MAPFISFGLRGIKHIVFFISVSLNNRVSEHLFQTFVGLSVLSFGSVLTI